MQVTTRMEIIMKKNILTVIITALTVINVILTAIMFFVMLPTFQKTNNLITQVAAVLNIELDGDAQASGDADYTLKDLENVEVTFETQQTLNLASGADGKQHYAMMDGYVLSVNKTAKDYKEMNTAITNNKSQITDIVRSVIQSHTNEDITEDIIKKEALEKIQEFLDSKVVVGITLTNFMHQ